MCDQPQPITPVVFGAGHRNPRGPIELASPPGHSSPVEGRLPKGLDARAARPWRLSSADKGDAHRRGGAGRRGHALAGFARRRALLGDEGHSTCAPLVRANA
jgi:hypothetical protein